MMLAGGTLPGVLRHPDPPLSDGVITLRAKTGADADALTAACQDPEIPRWTRVPVPTGAPTRSPGSRPPSSSSTPASRSTGWPSTRRTALLASVAVMQIDREPGTGEIGYWVAREARGRGVATRAVRLVGEWAARELGLTTLEIVVHEDNAPSIRVARSAGFTQTGERRVAPREGLPEGRYLVFTPAP